MPPPETADQARTTAYLATVVIFAAIALSLAWLQVEDVIDPAASQIVTLGTGLSSSSPCGCLSCTPVDRSEVWTTSHRDLPSGEPVVDRTGMDGPVSADPSPNPLTEQGFTGTLAFSPRAVETTRPRWDGLSPRPE